jgi:hypothetical protein
MIYRQLFIIQVMGRGGEAMDNPKPKPQLKQKQTKHGTEWI